MEEEKKDLIEKIRSFRGLQKWGIPLILTNEGEINDLTIWREDFIAVVNKVLDALVDDPNQENA